MNLKTVYRLAKILTFSQLRTTRGRSSILNFLMRPFSILLIDVAVFAGAFMIAKIFSVILTDPSLTVQIMADMPMFLIFMVMLSGLLWELSYSFSFASTDMVNYLPISTAEYVLASSISIVFAYSFYLAIGLGGALALALRFGLLSAWAMTAVMSLTAVFIGAFGVEVLRAFTNRASSILYKRSGKAVLFLRMAVLITSLVFIQLLFNPNVMVFILDRVTGSAKAASYFPLFWPSLAVTSFIEKNLASTSRYTFLTFALASFLFIVCARLRQAYWMPVPVSVKLSESTYAPGTGLLVRLGLNPAESAIVRKDLKSLIRRKEMASYLAVPFLIVATMLIPSLIPAQGRPSVFSNIMFLAFPLTLSAVIFAYMNSSISIGQEGYAFWNIYSSPISPGEFIKAKVSVNLILSLPIALAFWIGIILLGNPTFKITIAFLLILISLILVESLIGLMMGVMFPDFSETIRSRFIRIPGMLLGMLLATITTGVLLVPYWLYILLKHPVNRNFDFILASLAIFTLTVLISVIAYRLCISKTEKLFRELTL